MVTDKDKKQVPKKDKKIKPPELADTTSWMAEQPATGDENANLAKPSDIKKLDTKTTVGGPSKQKKPKGKKCDLDTKYDLDTKCDPDTKCDVTSKCGVDPKCEVTSKGKEGEEIVRVETIIDSPALKKKKSRGSSSSHTGDEEGDGHGRRISKE